jgi:hypothetical protein
MSTIGFLAGRVNREQVRLEKLSQSLLIVHASILGHTARLGLTSEKVENARAELATFAEQVRQALKDNPSSDPDVAAVIARLPDYGQVPSDWSEDFAVLADKLRDDSPLTSEQLAVLRKALGFFRQYVGESLSRIRPR